MNEAHHNSDAPIFLDGTGRRARRVRLVAACVAIAALLLATGFVASLLIAPRLLAPAPLAASRPILAHRHHAAFRAARRALFRRIAADERTERALQPLGA